jgi:thiol-disulfide isomerase/thioredoxin
MATEVETTGVVRRRRGPLVAVVAVAVVAALAGIYGFARVSRNTGDPACRPAVDLARHIEPLVHGQVAAVRLADTARHLPVLTFRDADGQPKSLADWHGRTVLLNLWATWCVPCRKEMPALDALEGRLGTSKFEVVAINIDTRDPEKPKSWLHDAGIHNLAYYSDGNAKVFQDLKAVGKAIGMPTTLLVDPNGCEIASLSGPAEWASDDGVALVSAALQP